MNRCPNGSVKLIFDKLERQLGTHDFLTLFRTILTDRRMSLQIPTPWKRALTEPFVLLSIFVTLCEVGRKVALNRRTPCFVWFCIVAQLSRQKSEFFIMN